MVFSPKLSQIRDIIEGIAVIVAMVALLIIGVVKITHDNEAYASGYHAGFVEACQQYEEPVEIGYPLQ